MLILPLSLPDALAAQVPGLSENAQSFISGSGSGSGSVAKVASVSGEAKSKTDDGRTLKAVIKHLGLINHPDAMHYLQRYFNDCGEAELANINPNKLPHAGYINQLSQILLPVSEGLEYTVLPARYQAVKQAITQVLG